MNVNELKTQIMIVGHNKNHPQNYNEFFKLQDKYIKIVDSYCYLGINLHKSGNFQIAQ